MQQHSIQKPFVRISRQQHHKAATIQHSRNITAAAAASSDFQPLDAPASFSSSSAASSSSSSGPADTRKKVVVVGGGWAGFGAAKHLAEQGYAVTLIEAAKNPGGLSGGFRTSSGKVVEAGMKGFWHSYSNIFALLKVSWTWGQQPACSMLQQVLSSLQRGWRWSAQLRLCRQQNTALQLHS
jgi:hypothetical protein